MLPFKRISELRVRCLENKSKCVDRWKCSVSLLPVEEEFDSCARYRLARKCHANEGRLTLKRRLRERSPRPRSSLAEFPQNRKLDVPEEGYVNEIVSKPGIAPTRSASSGIPSSRQPHHREFPSPTNSGNHRGRGLPFRFFYFFLFFVKASISWLVSREMWVLQVAITNAARFS